MGVRIKGIGFYVPEKRLTNFDLERLVKTTDEWIIERTGIKERRQVAKDEATSDLAYEAARVALKDAELHARDLDAILVATATPDMFFPSTACLLQYRLKARQVFALDIEAACPGFLYGLDVVSGLLHLKDHYKTVLLVGAENLTRIVDFTDRNTCVLFGDGAGAVVLIRDNSHYGIISSYLGGDGRLSNLLYLPAGGTRLPASEETVKKRLHFMKMQGKEVFKYAVLEMQRSAQIALKEAGLRPQDIDWFIPHQANIRIIEATRARLKIPEEKVYINIDRFGNTSVAAIPIALSEMKQNELLKPGNLILMVSFGAGFTWGATVMRWG